VVLLVYLVVYGFFFSTPKSAFPNEGKLVFSCLFESIIISNYFLKKKKKKLNKHLEVYQKLIKIFHIVFYGKLVDFKYACLDITNWWFDEHILLCSLIFKGFIYFVFLLSFLFV
jgi:hypothetical protein